MRFRRVAANRKSAKSTGHEVKEFTPTSATYDNRIFSLFEKNWSVSIALLEGREKFDLHIGNYQRGKLKGQKPKTATLVKRKDGTYYIDIQLESIPPKPAQSKDALGVDLGRTDIAVTSEGEKWNGKDITQIRDKYSRVRAQLQHKASKGTRSSRRRCRELVKRLAGQEKRFQKQVNHAVSKRIVLRAVELKADISMEDLTGIRDRTNRKPRSKTERRRSNSWACYQLRQFVAYKAVKFGAKLLLHNPAWSSQTHHVCLHIGERKSKVFYCPTCQVREDADENAAKVLRLMGLSINQPRGSELLSCSLSYDASGLLKTPLLAAG